MRLYHILFSIFGILLIFSPSQVLASEVIRSFDVSIVAHKDGTFDVTEEILYDFGEDRKHGIIREIPLVSNVGNSYRIIEVDFKAVLKDGENEDYVLEGNNSQALVKIGEADEEITGSHKYTITYLVKNGIGSNFEDHDELYWNVTGNDWRAPIIVASARVSTDFNVIPDKAICYAGPHGSTIQNCDYGQVSSITSSKLLMANEGLTAVWSFPKGTFPPSILQKDSPRNGSLSSVNSQTTLIIGLMLLTIPILLNFMVTPGLLIWYFKKKRKERFGLPSVNFDLPKDSEGTRVAPAEAGSIDIHRVDQNDLIATIFDLAIRKYLKIKQVKKDKVLGIFGKDEDFIFIKLKDVIVGTNQFEQTILTALFKDGDSVKLSDLKKDFYLTFAVFENNVFNSLVERKFYIKNPKNQMALFLTLGIIVIFIGGILLGPVLIFLSRKLNGRTAEGDQVDWRLDGLKIFLKNMKRHHDWQVRNLIAVEEYIPYAIAFGIINEFMEDLKVIYPNYKPNWYTGNVAFYAMTTNMFSTFSSTFTTQAPSSSSGGFSGGGGGGGGGGSW